MRLISAVFLSLLLICSVACGAHVESAVFMGDSITAWWDLKTYFPGSYYLDKGVPGNTTAQMLARFDVDVIAHQPKVVVILGGTNSIGYVSNEQVEQELQAMYTAAQQAGIRVVACTITPRRPSASDARGDLTPQILVVNEWIKQYAAANGIVVADYYLALAGPDGLLPKNLTTDFVHLTPAAYEKITPVADREIAAVLASGN
jgi:lysophospholipase L1-like esterase